MPMNAPPNYPTQPAYQHPLGPPPPYTVSPHPNQMPPGSALQGVPIPGQPPYNYYSQTPAMGGYAQYPNNMVSQAQLASQYPGPTSNLQHGVYAAGARFGPGAGAPIVPPPPPGYAPNPAQQAAMQGQHVVMTKKENDFFSGGKGAGYTFF